MDLRAWRLPTWLQLRHAMALLVGIALVVASTRSLGDDTPAKSSKTSGRKAKSAKDTKSGSSSPSASQAGANGDAMMAALQAIQEMVGSWEGSGITDDQKRSWDERIECAWKFKSGKSSLYFTFAAGKSEGQRLLDEAMVTYDPERSLYLFRAYKAGDDSGEAIVFEGTAKTKTNLVLERVQKGSAKDSLDLLDIKILNEGDRIVYSFRQRLGTSKRFRPYARVALDRVGTSLAATAASGPKCIVTGGAGTIAVSYEGTTYYVCCSGCREMFLEDPKRFITKAK